MTLGEWIRRAEARLRNRDVESPRLEAQVLAAHALGVARPHVLAHADDPLSETARATAEGLLERRAGGEPLAYIVGTREFFGRPFRVGPGVLVPRQETETLVEATLARAAGWKRVLDLGTGSGCIGATLALEAPALRVVASDRSLGALAIARANVVALGARVDLVAGDACSPFAEGAFDAVVANPPYVGERDPLPRDVAEWEPPEALFAGEDGLAFYRRLAAEAPRVLRPGGTLLVEMGDGQAEAVGDLLVRAGWEEVTTTRDLGGVERVVEARRPETPTS